MSRRHHGASATDQTPAPLTEVPPEDRFCDLVINGGVASGVVYPWAILQLARVYRFKSIGGNSVGAMAAALAAAAEYGRCRGFSDAFEPLRRLPGVLAEEDAATQPKMLRLFVPTRGLERVFDLFLLSTSSTESGPPDRLVSRFDWWGRLRPPQPDHLPKGLLHWVIRILRLYGLLPLLLVLLALALLGALASVIGQGELCLVTALMRAAPVFLGLVLLGLVLAALVLYRRLKRDLRALAANGYGICTGKGDPQAGPQDQGREGLVEWLHRGIQLSAGRKKGEAPLTFADLWSVPRQGVPGPAPAEGGLKPVGASIDLQMFSTNIALGRPVRLPLNDANTRLFYRRSEWQHYFPDYLLDALEAASRPYQPLSDTEPDPRHPLDAADKVVMDEARELPSGDLPIVVAARLSLSFPLLFSCVPLWAIDYEAPHGARRLRKCWMTDGGLCHNFPVHLFDAACPRWPTFAFLLDRRLKSYDTDDAWLPIGEGAGRADNWQRGVPGVSGHGPSAAGGAIGLAMGMLSTMKDWNDRMAGRLPHVRNRMVRMALKADEGQLHIAMAGERIIEMAARYGPLSADKLIEAYLPQEGEGSTPAWRQQLYVRTMIELRSLRAHLRNFGLAAYSAGPTLPLRQLLQEASAGPILLERDGKPHPPGAAAELSQADVREISRVLDAIEALERELAACTGSLERYHPKLEPEIRLRAPI